MSEGTSTVTARAISSWARPPSPTAATLPEQPTDCGEWTAPPLVSGAVYVIHDAVEHSRTMDRSRCGNTARRARLRSEHRDGGDPGARSRRRHLLRSDECSRPILDGDGYDDLLATSWDADTSGTVSFFPGPIAPGDLDLQRDDAVGNAPFRTSVVHGLVARGITGRIRRRGGLAGRASLDRRRSAVGSVALGAPTASGDPAAASPPRSRGARSSSWARRTPTKVHVLDGVTFDPLGVLAAAPMLGMVGRLAPVERVRTAGRRLTAPGATRNLTHQGSR
jgi:hypothetical protein